ncbi:MAG: DALR domain-containing protein, partial [Arenimonas sp.]
STCAHGGKVFARFWLHNGMLNFGGSKMSKSVGNVSVLHELLAKHPPEALRYALLSAHYRQPLDWSDALIEQSVKTLDRLYGTLRDLSDYDVQPNSDIIEIESALDDDLNTPSALAALNQYASFARHILANEKDGNGNLPEKARAELANAKADILGAGLVLGLLQQSPEAWFARGADGSDDSRIQGLVDERTAAKAGKDFARADAIRKQLADEGILLEDTPQGVRWKRA